MNNLKEYFDFGINNVYISPLYPKNNEVVEIKFLAKDETYNIRMNYKRQGTWSSIDLNKKQGFDNGFTLFSCSLKFDEDALFYFLIEKDESFYYFSKLGFSVALPCDTSCFKLILNIESPSWVSNSTCYQIFPDRFKNGNKEIGVETGEYEFDGGTSKSMSFDSKPLSFEKGRCLDFFNGDLKGIEDSLDYLKSIGVTCLYLNPIAVSKTTHRYDCCDFFHVDEKLGGDEALISLINAAHVNGIKVIVDISINHTGIDHPWFKAALKDKISKEASYYYIDENNRIAFWEDVKTLPQLNYNNQELRNIMYKDDQSVIKKFLNEPFNQDGWRFDVADQVGRRGRDQFNTEIWKEVRQSIKKDFKDSYILAESWIDSSEHLQGDQWDATMNYIGCARPLRRWMGEEDRFTAQGWGHSPRKVNAYSAKDLAIALKSQLDSIPPQMAQFQMNLIDSHDTPRLHNNKQVFNWNNYVGSTMLMFTLPGMPNIYYGDEIALSGQMHSMEMSRYPMQWDKSKWNKDFYNLYKTLGDVRIKYNQVFYLGAFKILDLHKDIFTFVRYNSDKVIFTILNKENKEVTLNLDIPYLMLENVEESLFGVEVNNKSVYLKEKENAVIIFNRKGEK